MESYPFNHTFPGVMDRTIQLQTGFHASNGVLRRCTPPQGYHSIRNEENVCDLTLPYSPAFQGEVGVIKHAPGKRKPEYEGSGCGVSGTRQDECVNAWPHELAFHVTHSGMFQNQEDYKIK